jgi:hypothetical protein
MDMLRMRSTCSACGWKDYLIFTLFTGHVIAAAILFNRRETLCALLGVGRDPIRRLRVVGALLEPEPNEGTDAGLVVGEETAKAKGVAAEALDGGDGLFEFGGGRGGLALDGVLAVGGGTPL